MFAQRAAVGSRAVLMYFVFGSDSERMAGQLELVARIPVVAGYRLVRVGGHIQVQVVHTQELVDSIPAVESHRRVQEPCIPVVEVHIHDMGMDSNADNNDDSHSSEHQDRCQYSRLLLVRMSMCREPRLKQRKREIFYSDSY
jgi:hypothetical protein